MQRQGRPLRALHRRPFLARLGRVGWVGGAVLGARRVRPVQRSITDQLRNGVEYGLERLGNSVEASEFKRRCQNLQVLQSSFLPRDGPHHAPRLDVIHLPTTQLEVVRGRLEADDNAIRGELQHS